VTVPTSQIVLRRLARYFRCFLNQALAAALLIALPFAAGRGLPASVPPPPRFVPVKADIHVIAALPGPDSSLAQANVADSAAGGDTILLSKTASAPTVAPGGTLTYTLAITNATNVDQTFRITDTLPSALSYVSGTATIGLFYNAASTSLTATRTLTAFQGDVITTTGAPSYYELSAPGHGGQNICQAYFPQCDDNAITLGGSMLAFRYLGVDYTTITLDSNGFVIPGSAGTTADNQNQDLPDTAAPNGVIAPFWDDLDLNGSDPVDMGGGDWYYGVVQEAANLYLVVEWHNAQKKHDASRSYSFQVWIQQHTEHITFAYDHLTGTTSSATIGFENSNGTLGYSYLFNGAGSVPAPADELELKSRFYTAQFGFVVKAHHVTRGCSPLANTVILSNGPGTLSASASAATYIFGPCLFLPWISR
jgi:uncharacterized repeat protein (TIGR01451 family)